MRDRLIELIGDFPTYGGTLKEKWWGEAVERLADHLLANGVIVPPCKVGDTVYIVDGTTDGIVEGKITHFEFNLYTTPREWITVVGNYPFVGELEERNRIDLLLGKTVFLTIEEAEKALAERIENGKS